MGKRLFTRDEVLKVIHLIGLFHPRMGETRAGFATSVVTAFYGREPDGDRYLEGKVAQLSETPDRWVCTLDPSNFERLIDYLTP